MQLSQDFPCASDPVPNFPLRSGAAVLAAALCLMASIAPAAGAKIIKINIEKADFTVAYGINDGGSITGGFGSGSGVYHGFVRAADGTVTAFDPPGSSVTYGLCINGKGAIGGYWIDYTGSPAHGFLRTPKGKYTSFDPAGSIDTEPYAINDTGVIAGYFSDNNGYHGFIRTP